MGQVTRPPPRDQPSDQECRELAERLAAVVRERQRLLAATVVRGPDSRQVHVLPDEHGRVWLALVEHGRVLAEREVDTRWLLAHLGVAPGFADLAALLDP